MIEKKEVIHSGNLLMPAIEKFTSHKDFQACRNAISQIESMVIDDSCMGDAHKAMILKQLDILETHLGLYTVETFREKVLSFLE